MPRYDLTDHKQCRESTINDARAYLNHRNAVARIGWSGDERHVRNMADDQVWRILGKATNEDPELCTAYLWRIKGTDPIDHARAWLSCFCVIYARKYDVAPRL